MNEFWSGFALGLSAAGIIYAVAVVVMAWRSAYGRAAEMMNTEAANDLPYAWRPKMQNIGQNENIVATTAPYIPNSVRWETPQDDTGIP